MNERENYRFEVSLLPSINVLFIICQTSAQMKSFDLNTKSHVGWACRFRGRQAAKCDKKCLRTEKQIADETKVEIFMFPLHSP